MDELSFGKIASVSGRYYAMDRDNNWDREQKAYDMLTLGEGKTFEGTAEACALASYEEGVTDEFIVPTALTVYFVAVAVGASTGAVWALQNPTYLYMNGWFHYAKLYAATIGCIGFMMLKYKWGWGKTEWFKVFPFVIVALNILIAVGSDFESAIKGAIALQETGSAWWLSSENVWLYGGWWN